MRGGTLQRTEGHGVAFLWVGFGGFLGAIARFWLGREIGQRLGLHFPYGTLVVNLTGAFLIGFVFTILTDRVVDEPMWRQLLIVGFLGGYTTFSSFTYETIAMIQDGRWAAALGYVFGSNALGLLACFAGMGVAKAAGL
jgi:CrcB protein